MKTIKKYVDSVLAVLIVLSLTGCSNDDDVSLSFSEYKDAVVGEWYAELGKSENIKQRIIFEFAQDGSMSIMSTYVSAYNSDYIKGDGSYTVNGNKLSESYMVDGIKGSGEYDIRSVGKYDMHLFLKANQKEETDYRIVETIHLKEGETYNVYINDSDFYPDEFFSDDEKVVVVDNAGCIKAVRQGTAYILVRSSIGTAVVRVVVESETYVDNFLKYMGEQINVTTEAYGDLYYEDYKEKYDYYIRGFLLQDEKMAQIEFVYTEEGFVSGVTLLLREITDIEKIRYAFCRYYEYINEKDGIQYYSATKLARKINIDVYESKGLIEFSYESVNDPFAEANNLVKRLASMTAEEIAAENDVTVANLKFIQSYLGAVDYDVNDTFSKLSFRFNWDTGKIYEMALFPKNNISFEEYDSWYSRNYISTGYDSDNFMYMCLKPNMYIRFIPIGETYYVYYKIQ